MSEFVQEGTTLVEHAVNVEAWEVAREFLEENKDSAVEYNDIRTIGEGP